MAGVKSMGVEDFGGWIHSKAGLDVVRDSPPLPGSADEGRRVPASITATPTWPRIWHTTALPKTATNVYTPSVFW